MQDDPKHPLQGRTVIGTFTETWDAESAYEDLKFAGYEGYLRYVKHDDPPGADDTKTQGGFHNYFAKVYGFDDHEDYEDSRGNFTVNPEAEEYFSEAFTKKLHVLLIQVNDTIDKAIDIIHLHHGKVEVKHWSFFTAMAKDEHVIPGETYQKPPRIHPTRAISMPRDETP